MINAPKHKFRIIRGKKANYKVAFYSTKERRDERAQYFADRDGDVVMCEQWTEDTARNADPINGGWGTDAFKHPSKAMPTEMGGEGDHE